MDDDEQFVGEVRSLVRILSLPPKEQCDREGDYNVSWERRYFGLRTIGHFG